MWRYQIFARKLTWYFIGVYVIKEHKVPTTTKPKWIWHAKYLTKPNQAPEMIIGQGYVTKFKGGKGGLMQNIAKNT